MKHTARKIPDRIGNVASWKFSQQLVHAVREVQSVRQLDAAEDPAVQAAWDRLRIAVLEAEHFLENKFDKRRR